MGKPKGWQAFDSLARKVVSVPKEAVDAKVVADKKAGREKKKAKRKKS